MDYKGWVLSLGSYFWALISVLIQDLPGVSIIKPSTTIPKDRCRGAIWPPGAALDLDFTWTDLAVGLKVLVSPNFLRGTESNFLMLLTWGLMSLSSHNSTLNSGPAASIGLQKGLSDTQCKMLNIWKGYGWPLVTAVPVTSKGLVVVLLVFETVSR